MTGRDMVGAALAVYGSRTTIIVYNTVKKVLQEFTLRENDNGTMFWEKTREKIKLQKSTRIFSPANSRSMLDNLPYR